MISRCRRCAATLDVAGNFVHDGADHAECADARACATRLLKLPRFAYIDSAQRTHLVRALYPTELKIPARFRARIIDSLDPRAIGTEIELALADLQPQAAFFEARRRLPNGTAALRQACEIVGALR